MGNGDQPPLVTRAMVTNHLVFLNATHSWAKA